MQVAPDAEARDLDRRVELVNIGAGHAATALAALLGEVCAMRVPRACLYQPAAELRPWGIPAGAADGDTSGTFFEVSGAREGLVAWLLPELSRRHLLERVTGRRLAELGEHEVQSALRETSNIVVSHFVSAMAETLGAVLLPSVPLLELRDAPGVLRKLLEPRSATSAVLRIESELASRSGRFRSGLCFAQAL